MENIKEGSVNVKDTTDISVRTTDLIPNKREVNREDVEKFVREKKKIIEAKNKFKREKKAKENKKKNDDSTRTEKNK